MKKILSIFLCLTIISTIIYGSISSSLTENSIKESIKQNLLTGLIYDDNGDKTKIFETIMELTKLDEETVIKLMENETADELITDVVNSIYDYNLTKDESVKYTKEEIINLVENNMDKILNEINYPITEAERQEVFNYTENNTDEIIDKIYKTDIGDYEK